MKILKYLAMAIVVLTTTSCLKANLEDLPTWGESNITDIRFDYRYYGSQEWVDGGNVVEYMELKLVDKVVNKEAKTVTCKVQVPVASGTFTVAEKAKVNLTNIAGILWVSQAARVTPIEGAPILGVAGDWSKPNKYEIMAANGTKSVWVITVTSIEQL